MKSMIYSKGYGSVNVYPATIENALTIFESHMEELPYRVVKDNEKVIATKELFNVLKEILMTETGKSLPKTRDFLYGKHKGKEKDNRPTVLNSLELKGEVSICMVNQNLTIKNLDSYYISQERNILSGLPTLAKVLDKKQPRYLTEDEIDTLHNYEVICNNNWTTSVDDSKNIKIVRFILSFVQENLIDKSRIEYELAEYSETVNIEQEEFDEDF